MSARGPVRSAVALAAALVVGIVFSAGAQAAPGDLDLTFSGDGKQTTNIGFGISRAEATVRQPDGKIVAVGTLASSPSRNFALARYNPNGSLDPSFSGDGRQVTDFGQEDEATGVALQADGKIVVVGTAFATFPGSPTDDFALARYNPNGSLDTSFSGDGKQTTDFGSVLGFDAAKGVAIQTDGKIVAVGRAGVRQGDFGLARYNPNGSLDPSFSGNGKHVTDFGGSEQANGVAIQGDGQIVAVGRAGGSGSDFALARYDTNGSLDTSFSGDGKETTNFGFTDFANQVGLQGDGKIVAVGFTGSAASGGGGDFALARYETNGSLDGSFSGDGRQTTDFSPGASDRDEATGVALQTDGRIVAVGPIGGNDFALARYDIDGSLDPSFSGDGKQGTDFGGLDQAQGAALQADGKILAVGVARATFPGGPGGDFAIARYNPNGSLDTSFSGDGRQTADFAGEDEANGVALQVDGKIVVVGLADDATTDFALARYNPNGSLDTSFAGDGKQTTDFGGFERATGVAIQSDGRIVVVGWGDGGFTLARYNPNGTLDTSFSGDGKQTTDFSGGTIARANGVTLQANGKIVAAGTNNHGGFALARYHPNGSLDSSFSVDGKHETDFGGHDEASGVAIQGDGKIVVVGRGGPGTDFALARYNPNGSPDMSFSGDGKQTTSFSVECCEGDGATGVALQANGKIVAVGGAGGDSESPASFALARYNLNGELDTSFSGDGKQETEFEDSSFAAGVALQGDGKIVAAGHAGILGGDFALARYDLNGTLDPGFSGDGKQTTDFGGFGRATGVAIQGDGKVVVAGSGSGTDGTSDFALARYLGG